MTQSMRRWMLAAVIAAAMVIASAGVGAADQTVYNFDPNKSIWSAYVSQLRW